MSKHIEITQDKILPLIKEVYRRSVPVGMGFVHFKKGDLPPDQLLVIYNHAVSMLQKAKLEEPNMYGVNIVNMDYVLGRKCKFGIWVKNRRLFIRDTWCDHIEAQFEDLLEACGIARVRIDVS